MYISNYFNVYFLTKYSNLKKKFINFMHQTSVNCERQKRKEAIVTDDYYSNYFRRECKFIFWKIFIGRKNLNKRQAFDSYSLSKNITKSGTQMVTCDLTCSILR